MVDTGSQVPFASAVGISHTTSASRAFTSRAPSTQAAGTSLDSILELQATKPTVTWTVN